MKSQKNITTNLDKLLDVVLEIQKEDPELLLCGSLALMFAKKLDSRPANDIDFVVNQRYIEKLISILDLDRDRYPEIKADDDYDSYHGSYFYDGDIYLINVLAFKDNITLNKQYINYDFERLKIQDIDTILHYKAKYNRTKDVEDLNNIANNEIESILAE